MPDHSPSTDERASLAQPSQSSSPLECTSHLGFSPNPPSKGDSVVERRIRGRRPRFFALHQGRSATKRDRQWPLGAPMVAYSGCGERKGRIGHGKRRSRTGMARVGGDVQLAGWRVSGGRAPSGRQGAADGDAGGPPRMLRSPGRIRRPAIIRRLFLETGEVEWIELKVNSNVGTSATLLDQLSKRYVGAWVAAGKPLSLRDGDTGSG